MRSYIMIERRKNFVHPVYVRLTVQQKQWLDSKGPHATVLRDLVEKAMEVERSGLCQ